jgi:ABC-type polysaccharide/polyol phosphate transport system ATPase subunit
MSLPIVSRPRRATSPGDDTAIWLDDVTVRYLVPREPVRTFKEHVIRMLQRRVQRELFVALHDVDLEVTRGETFGIIGHNGAGKSTLLKVIARVLRPATGRVWVRGRLHPLLELGAGFHFELTGRENIYLNGALLGYSNAEIARQFDGIVDFAGVEAFIDAPLRTYSTGMVARLGFAIATAAQPDILIVDEVLSVGDEEFQRKCQARMTQFQDHGATILLVSHNLLLIQQMCARVAWLDHGHMRALGPTHEVIAQYVNAVEGALR